jgi:hypothetical protein
MPRGDRGKGNPSLDWTLPVIGVVLVVFLSWGVGWLQASEKQKRQQTPAAYQNGAKQHAQRTCIGIEPSAVFECVYEHVETAKQTAHDEQDLSAQQRAASSALAAAAIAFFTLIITGIGVWFVKRTLEATLEAVEDTGRATDAMHDANEIARMAYNANVRPWLSLKLITEKTTLRWSEAEEGFIFGIGLNTQNEGGSPAIDVTFWAKASAGELSDIGYDRKPFFDKCCDELRLHTLNNTQGEIVFPRKDASASVGAVIRRSDLQETFDRAERFWRQRPGEGFSGEGATILPNVFVGCGYRSSYDATIKITAYLTDLVKLDETGFVAITFMEDLDEGQASLRDNQKRCVALT